MLKTYIECGARAFQIDMPSQNPFAETEFVKSMMKAAVESGEGYDAYMDGIREIRERYPEIEMHIVVYNDVIDSIGLQKFAAFCREISAASLMIPGSSSENLLYLELCGFRVFRSITHELSEVRIRLAQAVGEGGIVSLRNKKPGERDVEGLETFSAKYDYVVNRCGVSSPIYSVFGISTPEQLAQIKATGARGAIIGNVLMKLWDDKDAFVGLLKGFQTLYEE